MATLNFASEAMQPLMRWAQVGVFGSSDLAVLIEPSNEPTAHVRVRTNLAGDAQHWKAVLDRFFSCFEPHPSLIRSRSL
jgi:malonate decarboxylase delta subunit